ncbi:MAG: hypothetical protein ACE5R6_08955 [Candidatus Heimdallarchaeota archaeon]
MRLGRIGNVYLFLLLIVITFTPKGIEGCPNSSPTVGTRSFTILQEQTQSLKSESIEFNKNITLQGGSVINVTGLLQLENATVPRMNIGERYPFNSTITLLSWGSNVDRLYKIRFILHLLAEGANVLSSVERETFAEIHDLNYTIHLTVFFIILNEEVPDPAKIVTAALILACEEGRAPIRTDAKTEVELIQFPLDLTEGPSLVETSPTFTFNQVQGIDGTLLRVSGNIAVEKADPPFWYYDQTYTIHIELEVLKWGWDARGPVRRIHDIQVSLNFIGEGGVRVHSMSTSTEPSEIVALNAPVIHEFAYSVSKLDIDSLSKVILSFQIRFQEEILDQDDETTKELTRFSLELKEMPPKERKIAPWMIYGGASVLIVVIGIIGLKWFRKRQEDYWFK